MKIDKRVLLLNPTEAYIYKILVYAKFTNKQISRSYLQKTYGKLSVRQITRILTKLEEVGLIKRDNRYTNDANGYIIEHLGYQLIYNTFYMLKFNTLTWDIEDKKAEGFAIMLRALAFDDTLAIKYNKTELADKLGVSKTTLNKYLNILKEKKILVEDNKLNKEYFITKKSPVVYLSDDNTNTMNGILANSDLKDTKLYKQLAYYKENYLDTHPAANKIFADIMAGVFACPKKDEKKPCVFTFTN